MGKAALVDSDIENGKKLLEALEKSSFPVQTALWLYKSEADAWRLVIASVLVDRKGPRAAYRRLRAELARSPAVGVPFSDVSLVSTRDELIRALRSAVRTGPGTSAIRFSNNVVGNFFGDDAYVYRVL